MAKAKASWLSYVSQFFMLLLLSTLALQVFWALRILTMRYIHPESTAFQRSEIVRLLTRQPLDWNWSHQWVRATEINSSMAKAVIASEDSSFTEHFGVDWDAIEKAWSKNQKVAQKPLAQQGKKRKEPKIIGGSTITQQLAKNLFLSGERTIFRKVQELLLTFMLEALLSKSQIMEIYLNHIEWGQGVFGVEAAAQHYFKKPSRYLTGYQSAQLAVMLPAPRKFEKNPQSAYLLSRANTIHARMGAVTAPRP